MISSRSRAVLTLLFILIGVFSCSEAKDTSVAVKPEPAPELLGEDLTQAIDTVALVAKKDPELATSGLAEYAKHPDFLIRVQALRWLAMEKFRAIPGVELIFLNALDDPHWLVRSFAVRALKKNPTQASRDALASRYSVEENSRVKGYIEAALR